MCVRVKINSPVGRVSSRVPCLFEVVEGKVVA